MEKSIKAICFDLDGVYFTNTGKKGFHNRLVSDFGLSEEVVSQFLYKSETMSKFVRGQISPEEFCLKFQEITGTSFTVEQLAEYWTKDYQIDEKVRQVVLKARELGYKTCVCTNNNQIRLSFLRAKYNLNENFDVLVSSHEVGFCKPTKEIYEELLKRLNITGEDLVYSDDNADRLQGANELGINTFVFENFEQFLSELNKLGINL
jgi:epoxide hydrolase-like predicted phosphatase